MEVVDEYSGLGAEREGGVWGFGGDPSYFVSDEVLLQIGGP